MTPKFPNIKVRLSGEDGNSFAIIGRCVKAMKRAHLTDEDISEFRGAAMSGDYDNLLRVCMEWFDVQ